MREAVGPDVLVMLDANNAWTDLPTALQTMRRFEPYDPYWIEEPFCPDDIDNHARLAQRTPIPVATGEIEAGRWRHKELLDKAAAAILQTDAAVCGGITEFRRIAATAASYGVPIAPHWFHDLHVHLVGGHPERDVRRVLPRRQRAELPRPPRHPARPPRRPPRAADDARARVRLRRGRRREVPDQPVELTRGL